MITDCRSLEEFKRLIRVCKAIAVFEVCDRTIGLEEFLLNTKIVKMV